MSKKCKSYRTIYNQKIYKALDSDNTVRDH